MGGALMLAESAAALAVPWLGSKLAEAILRDPATNAWGIPAVLGALLALFAIQGLLRFASTNVLGGTVARIDADLRTRVYDHLQALPIAFFQQRRHGDSLALLTRDVYLVSEYLGGTLVALGPLLFTVGGALVFMLQLQPMLALLAAILVPVFYLLIKILGRSIRPLSNELQEAHVNAISLVDQNLGALPAIKSFTREAQESRSHAKQVERIRDLTARQLRVHAAIGPAVQFIAAAGVLLVLWLASGQIEQGKLTPAELVAFLLYAQLLTRPVAGLADVYGQTQSVRAAVGHLLQALDEKPEPPGHIGATLAPIRGDITFEGVSFGYPGRPPALSRIDLRIAAGETVAIIGPNGAGKSTLAQLLLRMHEPGEGRITIDGTDIATASLNSLRGQIGVVPQHVLLFNDSARHNIVYGRPDATDAQIEAAARAARAHDFIIALPHGYDTVVGDHGVRLSGGQQQRLALARALLKDPRILILDEATAMFDPEGEREFLEACRDLLKRRTVILITHRPAPLAIADRTIRLEEGRVVSEGTESR
jgi:subfamily B ATP-binding cassette protein MsbA